MNIRRLINTVFVMGSCAFAHEESLGDTKSRLQTFDCLFQFAEDYASDTVLSSKLTKDVTSGYYYRYFDVTDSYLAVSEADNGLYLYQPKVGKNLLLLGDIDHWLTETSCNKDPIPVLSTSYANEHRAEVKPYELPIQLVEFNSIYHAWTSGAGLADFTGNGELELITSSQPAAFNDGKYADGTPFSHGDPGKIQFWRRNFLDNGWIEITDKLLTDNSGCMLPRKALIEDFNNDGKPDVYFGCTGHVKTSNVSTDSASYKEVDESIESPLYVKQLILLSQSDGSYRKSFTSDYKTYAHGSAAGDLNNDGFTDVIFTDEKKWDKTDCTSCADGIRYVQTRGNSLWFLFGKGDGTFDLSDGKNILPNEVFSEPYKYWAAEIIDFDEDGNLDIWLGGGAEDWILYNDGDGSFSERYLEMPKAANYYESLDLIKVGSSVYVLSINEDYSKPHYYWGDALTKIDLISMSSQLVYEHDGFYRTEGKCVGVSCWATNLGDDYLSTWFPWIIKDGEYIRPLDKQYDIQLYKLTK